MEPIQTDQKSQREPILRFWRGQGLTEANNDDIPNESSSEENEEDQKVAESN